MALPKANRLKSRQDFQAVFRDGIRRHGSYLTLRALRPPKKVVSISSGDTAIGNKQLKSSKIFNNTRFGISVSTKVSKKAVVRNRIKRQISAALYKLLPKLSPGWRIVVVVKPVKAECECGTLQFLQELEQLLAETEVFDGHS